MRERHVIDLVECRSAVADNKMRTSELCDAIEMATAVAAFNAQARPAARAAVISRAYRVSAQSPRDDMKGRSARGAWISAQPA